MSSRIKTILIVGATAGIGEALARRFHRMGKTVIGTGRNEEKLAALEREMPGFVPRQLFIDHVELLGSRLTAIIDEFPDLDTVFVTAGIQQCFNFLDPSTITPEKIATEITTNLTGPTVLVHHLAPHLVKLAESGTKTTLLLTSSTLAYLPIPFYPSYCASKAGVAALAKVLRQQLASASEPARKNMAVVEVVPPYTDTGLDREHREETIAMQGGPDKAFLPIPLDEFVEGFFEAWEGVEGPDGVVRGRLPWGWGRLGLMLGGRGWEGV
ncbi:NAD(P)-binding protein [Ophiocordyceps camponoti-floridani]|uniref:NAD(P)-binding protein n=1 Tax=Ophiocordyceps camponoti-floridani TaxID=2030778 RepID=A0A8H4VFJ9_9HYPO|nr:NAD(P)-binding protein [Ophiocordyceps camponoti-floridani]